MKIFKDKLFFLLFSLISFATGYTQTLSDTVFTPDLIKTVIIQKEGVAMSFPVIRLGGNERFLLSFDELSESVTESYRYRIQHCNQDWTPSELTPSQFINGFEEGSLSEFQFSFNTTQPYVHYELSFPERNDKFRESGNYVITVFPEHSPEQPILRKQFYVLENLTTINGKIKQPAQDRFKKQEIEIVVSPNANNPFFISNPKTDLTVLVMQNGRRDKLTKLPLYNVRGNEYNFIWNEANIFDGGNEFRNFDMKNIRIRSRYIDKIDFFGGEYHVVLFPERNRSGYSYSKESDINGKMMIHADDRDNPSIESDYGRVYFSLPMNQLRIDGRFYIVGQLTDWKLNKYSELKWNLEKKAYETNLFLKQGYYNYHLVFLPSGSRTGDETVIEGNHYETENEYYVFVYYRKFGDTFDRLAGFTTIR